MTRHAIICSIIGVSQLVLGAIYLVAPQGFIAWQGLSPVGSDIGYPLAMLAARFLVYGVGMFMIAREPDRYRIWFDGMIAIQIIDFLAGAYYVLTGVVAAADAAVPMANALAFTLLMLWVRRPAANAAA